MHAQIHRHDLDRNSSSSSIANKMNFKDTIKWFMDEHKEIYPYNDVPQTRSGYYPKWLLVMSRNTDGVVWRKLGHYAIKASCFNRENLQNMTMDGDATPLPAEFCEVVDSLDTWGGGQWTGWLHKTLHLFHGYLSEDSMYDGVAPDKIKMFHDCILLHVQRETMFSFFIHSANYNRVLETWNTCHWVRCRETYLFHELAFDSIHFVHDMIRSITSNNSAPSTPTGADVSESMTAAVTPESPISISMSTYAGESTQE